MQTKTSRTHISVVLSLSPTIILIIKIYWIWIMNEPSTYIKVFLERQMFMRKFTNNFHLRFCILFCKAYTRSEICNIYLLIPKILWLLAIYLYCSLTMSRVIRLLLLLKGKCFILINLLYKICTKNMTFLKCKLHFWIYARNVSRQQNCDSRFVTLHTSLPQSLNRTTHECISMWFKANPWRTSNTAVSFCQFQLLIYLQVRLKTEYGLEFYVLGLKVGESVLTIA